MKFVSFFGTKEVSYDHLYFREILNLLNNRHPFRN